MQGAGTCEYELSLSLTKRGASKERRKGRAKQGTGTCRHKLFLYQPKRSWLSGEENDAVSWKATRMGSVLNLTKRKVRKEKGELCRVVEHGGTTVLTSPGQ